MSALRLLSLLPLVAGPLLAGPALTDVPAVAATAATVAAQPAGAAGGAAVVRTADALRAALLTARPGAVITVADGQYVSSSLTAAVSGTAAAPITLRGTRAAVLRSTGTSGGYGLHITGSYWHVEGVTVAYASKGVVLDHSVGTVLRGLDVHDIGAEGVHFRSCSSGSALLDSTVRSTGLVQPAYGEGVYVGSAVSHWAATACDHGRDATARVLVQGNVFRDVPAEGADLKEGSSAGVLRGNLFDHVGYSGINSADSAVDAKGTGWLVEGNRVTGEAGSFLDGFQIHQVVAGGGTGNVFRANVVVGAIRGYGIALAPALTNVVDCSNTAPGAALGLSPVRCVADAAAPAGTAAPVGRRHAVLVRTPGT